VSDYQILDLYWFFRLEAAIFSSGIITVVFFILSKLLLAKILPGQGFVHSLRNERQSTSEDVLVRDQNIANFFRISIVFIFIGACFMIDKTGIYVFRGDSI
jgi:hypothetical protein